MSGPFVFVGNWSIKEGKVEEAKKLLAEHAESIEANEPRLISFNFYIDQEARQVASVQVHPDTESMEFHMELLSKHLESTGNWLDTVLNEQYYGYKSAKLTELLAPWGGDAVTTNIGTHLAGFTRSSVR